MDFSVVIPAKNEELNIGCCLDSILRVDYDPLRFEVIVVDNGSSDRTVEIARERGATVHVKPGLTVSGLRNFGAGNAKGKLVAFMDADCTVGRGWLAEASRYLARPEVVCFGSPPGVPDDATWVQSAWFLVRRKPGPVGETDWLESMNMFVRREPFLACGGFDETLATCEDYDLSVRMRRGGGVVCDGRITATHHGEAATLRHFFRKELWRGKSNIAGMLQHGLVLSEVPSVVAPLLHCLLFAAAVTALPMAWYGRGGWWHLVWPMLLWQCALLVKSMQKQWPAPKATRVAQLLCLLNVYLVARGISGLQGK